MAGIDEADGGAAAEVEGGLTDELVIQVDGVALEVADEADAVPGFGFQFVEGDGEGGIAGAEGDDGLVAHRDAAEGAAGGEFVGGFEIHEEFEIAIGFGADQGGGVGAFGFHEQAPVAGFPGGEVGGFPAAQVHAVVEGGPVGFFGGALIRRDIGGGEFLDADIAEFDAGAFGFEGDVAFAPVAVAAAGDFLAIDAEAEDAVGGDDAVVVPFGGGLGAFLRGEAAHAVVAAEGFHGGAMDGEDIAVGGEPVGLAVAVIEDLDLDGAQEWHAGPTDGGSPDEDAGIAAGFQVSPFEFEDEVLILALGAKGADGLASAVDEAVGDGPGLGGAVHIDPAIEVLAVEKGDEAFGIGFGGPGEKGGGVAFKVQSRQKNGEQERLAKSDEHEVKMVYSKSCANTSFKINS